MNPKLLCLPTISVQVSTFPRNSRFLRISMPTLRAGTQRIFLTMMHAFLFWRPFALSLKSKPLRGGLEVCGFRLADSCETMARRTRTAFFRASVRVCGVFVAAPSARKRHRTGEREMRTTGAWSRSEGGVRP